MGRVVRVGISLEPELLQRFDEIIRSEGYTNRSEAIRDMIREKLSQKFLEDPEAHAVGTITVIYDHHKGVVTDRMLHIQHHHLDVVGVSSHLHLDEDLCMEAILVKGKVKEVIALYNEIKSLRGILKTDLSLSSLSIKT